MKTLITIACVCLLGLGAHAERAASSISLDLWANSTFIIELDGQVYQNHGGTFNSPILSPGIHRLVVRESRHQNYGGQYNRVVYNGHIESRAFARTIALLHRSRHLEIKAFRPIRTGGHGIGNGHGHGTGFDNIHNHHHGAGCYTMGNRAFKHLMEDLDYMHYEFEKVELIRRATKGYELSTKQVKRMLKTLRRDESKLSLAKDLYYQTFDFWEYDRLESIFRYKYNKREFRRWLRACK